MQQAAATSRRLTVGASNGPGWRRRAKIGIALRQEPREQRQQQVVARVSLPATRLATLPPPHRMLSAAGSRYKLLSRSEPRQVASTSGCLCGAVLGVLIEIEASAIRLAQRSTSVGPAGLRLHPAELGPT